MEKNKEEQVQENQPSSEIEQDHKRKTPSISKDMIKVNEITPETKKSLKQRAGRPSAPRHTRVPDRKSRTQSRYVPRAGIRTC